MGICKWLLDKSSFKIPELKAGDLLGIFSIFTFVLNPKELHKKPKEHGGFFEKTIHKIEHYLANANSAYFILFSSLLVGVGAIFFLKG